METNKLCLVCGYLLEDSFIYCPHCSARVSNEQATDEYVYNITKIAEEIKLRKLIEPEEEATETGEADQELPEDSADKK